jgi:hypothetical protein
MKRTVVVCLAAVAAAAVLGAAPTSEAFSTLIPVRVWFVTPVAIDLDLTSLEGSVRDGDNGVTSMLNKVNDPGIGWDSAGAGDIVELYTTNIGPPVLGDGFPSVGFNDPQNICTGGCLAATLTGFFNQVAGTPEEIVDADMFFDAQARFTSEIEDPNGNGCNGEFFIEGVLQHEVGHVIGLGHSNVNGATMSAFVNQCTLSITTLATDDRNGANSIY